MKIRIEHVHYMPKELEPSILYVSKEYKTAAHLCACGCGEKIRTPLTPTEWSLEETDKGPTLRPSIGNWQLACQTHYWIYQGQVRWASKWSPKQITAGRLREEQHRQTYYENITRQHDGIIYRLWRWIKGFFS